MKKITATLLCLITLLFVSFMISPDAIAKGKKAKGLSPEDMTQITDTLTNLTRKVYASSLFSPKDNENLIDIKIKLDDALVAGSNPDLAPLYFKAANLYKVREMTDEAIECYQTVLDSFPDTPYAAKSINELKKMGVKIESPAGQNPAPAGK